MEVTSLDCLTPGPHRGDYMWHYQYDTFRGYIGEINTFSDYSHVQISASWTLFLHFTFKFKINHLFSPGSNSHVLEISRDIKFLKISNGYVNALAWPLEKWTTPLWITYIFKLCFFPFASSQSILGSHTALKKMCLKFSLCCWFILWISSNNSFVIYWGWTLCKLWLTSSVKNLCPFTTFWNETSINSLLFSHSYIQKYIGNLLHAELNVSM